MRAFLLLLFSSVHLLADGQSFAEKLSIEASKLPAKIVRYDPSYYSMPYPGGNPPEGVGVCTDVVIWSYRSLGYDLQLLIHEDMKRARSDYDKRRVTKKLDTNIDHRRTPNMMTFLERHGDKLPITNDETDYLPGDIVFWDIKPGHVGIVVADEVPFSNRRFVVHNICCGNKKEDFLFRAKIVGHYRWHPQ